MAKKRGRPAKSEVRLEETKAEVKLRIDRELHERLVAIAEESGISLNQLVQGMIRGLLPSVRVGRPVKGVIRHDDGQVEEFVSGEVKERGCVWWGKIGRQEDGEVLEKGAVDIRIDTTERGQVHFGF